MSKIVSFVTGELKEEKTSAWLVAYIQFAEKLGVFGYFENIKVKMKEVDYSVKQKLMVLMLSVVAGCRYTSEINEKLIPDKVAANILGLERFPDQSQINELLRRMTEENVKELKEMHNKLFQNTAQCLSYDGDVIVDIDQSGLIANGKNYELAEKGYFSKKKNQKGYQISTAFCSTVSNETLSLYLDSGNTHCGDRLDDILKDILDKLPEVVQQKRLILRLDSGYGSDENVQKLKNKTYFVTKCYSSKRASKLAREVSKHDWEEVANCVDLYELPSEGGLRYVLVRTLTKRGEFVYTMLITNIARAKMSAHDLFHFYNGRQTIEAFFKTCKNAYHIKNLRTKSFYGIYTFLWIVFMTHNLLSNMKCTIFQGTELETTGIQTIIKKLGTITAEVRKSDEEIIVIVPPLNRLATLFVECLAQDSKNQKLSNTA